MARIPGLYRRPDRHYYVRVRVPRAIQHIIGRKEIFESLGTSDPAEAKPRHAAAQLRIRTAFEEASRKIPLTAQEVPQLVREHYHESLATDQRAREESPDLSTLIEFNALISDTRKRALQDALVKTEIETVAEGKTITSVEALVGDLAEAILKRNGLSADPKGLEYRRLCKQLLRADRELINRAQERDSGDFTGKAADPLLAAPYEKTKSTPRLSKVIDDFVESKKTAKEWDAKTITIMTGRLRTCLELIGDKPIGEITPEEMEALRNEIQKVPASFRSRARSGTVRQAIKSAKEGTKRLSIATANLHIKGIKSVFIYAEKKGLIDRSPAKIIGDIKGDKKRRKPFTDDDLRLIFKDTQSAGDGPAYFWVPRILLYTGARLEEICQLHAEDIRQEHGIWVFDINRDGSKRLKTKNSERFVPVHSELIKMGLLKFTKKMEGHLFPELDFGKNGFSTNLSKRMGRYIRKIGIADPLKVANHSFRHTMTTRLGGAGVTEQTIDQLLGWKNDKNMRARYTSRFELESLRSAIEKFKASTVLP